MFEFSFRSGVSVLCSELLFLNPVSCGGHRVVLGVSGDFELQADQLGIQYAWKAGYDPNGYIRFFDKIATQAGYVNGSCWFRSHPPFYQEMVETQREMNYLPKQAATVVTTTDFAAMKEVSAFRGAVEAYLNDSERMSLLQARAFLQMLADSTGGSAWFPNQSQATPDVVEGAMQSVACQYKLVSQSPVRVDGKFYKIKVEVFRFIDDKCEDFKVHVRSGWR